MLFKDKNKLETIKSLTNKLNNQFNLKISSSTIYRHVK